jgi:hypothetical protein
MKNKIKKTIKEPVALTPNAKPDSGADKSGTDKDSDKTKLPDPKKESGKFDKPKRETDPDRTGIDIQKATTKKAERTPTGPKKSEPSKNTTQQTITPAK